MNHIVIKNEQEGLNIHLDK